MKSPRVVLTAELATNEEVRKWQANLVAPEPCVPLPRFGSLP